ncbi:GTP binding protein, partial [Coemansia brasiliensis]
MEIFRLSEGDGYAIYVIGVHDDGDVVGITNEEFESTVDTIKSMAHQLENTRIVSIGKRTVDSRDNRVVAEVHLSQKMPLPQTELRIAVLGDHGAGKSTVLGCITYNEEDDGRGKARLNLMRHQHELESGRTSSITLTAIGYSADGHVQNYANNRSAEDIYQRSQRVVTFIDTCGHTKHLKTTARALTGYTPHAFCVVIPADVAN